MAAKKTNKTEHVMSLLTGQTASQQAGHSADAKDGPAASPVKAPGQTIESQTVASQTIISQTIKEQAFSLPDPPQTPAHQDSPRHTPPPGVKFVESPKSEDNPISSAIKESLEREALQMGLYPAEEFSSPPGLQPEGEKEDNAPLRENTSAQENTSAPENTPLQENTSLRENTSLQENTSAPENTPLQENTPFQEEAEKEAGMTDEAPYRYVNIMEEGVKDRCLEFMTKLALCTCDRCQKDVTALALTNLPAKYIVADTAAISPLMNYYKNKYSAHIMTELAKACFAVHSQPRH